LSNSALRLLLGTETHKQKSKKKKDVTNPTTFPTDGRKQGPDATKLNRKRGEKGGRNGTEKAPGMGVFLQAAQALQKNEGEDRRAYRENGKKTRKPSP